MNLREEHNNWLDLHSQHVDTPLPVSEVFGPTIQGEGPHAGRACHFIRLGGCNLSCTWCDTPYSTGTHGIPLSTIPKRTPRSIAAALPSDALIIITGGEPLMHAKRPAFLALLHLLKAKGCELHIETNGTLSPGEGGLLIDHFTISPKIGVTMANPKHEKHTTPINWEEYADKAILKTVWCDDDADKFCQHSIQLGQQIGIPQRNIWVMPEGATAPELQQRWSTIAQAAADHNINATHRLHALAWGDEKGH